VPVPGQKVAFKLALQVEGAVIAPDTAETGPAGQAQTFWTLGNASGAQRVVANVVGLDGLEVEFDAVVGSGAAVRIEEVSGEGQRASVGTALRDSLVVRALDRFGNPVEGVLVDWEASEGSVDPAVGTTGSNGEAATYRILGRSVGIQTATASSAGLEDPSVTFSSTAVAGSADELVRVSGDNQTGSPGVELPAPLVVRLVDRNGNGVPERAVSWLVGEGGGDVDSPNTMTGANGETSSRWTLGSAETNTLNAVVSGVGVVTFTARALGGGGGGGGGSAQPTTLAFQVQPSDVREDRDIDPAVEVVVLDAQGNRFTSRDIEVKLELAGSGDGELQGHLTKRTKSGVATFSDLRVNRPGDYELHASADGLPTKVSTRFQVRDRKGEDGHGGGDD
jgi:hypothetical protein